MKYQEYNYYVIRRLLDLENVILKFLKKSNSIRYLIGMILISYLILIIIMYVVIMNKETIKITKTNYKIN